MVKFIVYNINTCKGKYIDDDLKFLTYDEFKEFNKIGSTGMDSKGHKSSYVRFLNELNKGDFTVEQTKFDTGDSCESFIITRTFTDNYNRTDENIPTEDEIIDTIIDCVAIRGVDLENFKINFSNERSGLYDAMLKLFNVKK